MRKNRGPARAMRLDALLRLIAVVACAALVYTGLWALSDGAGLRLDLTYESLSRLSEGTVQTLAAMDAPAAFHLVYAAATDSAQRDMLETLTRSYAERGPVTVDTIDPIAEPGRISPYQTSGVSVAEGSVIVESAATGRFEIVPAREMYAYTVLADGSARRTGLAAEKKLTAALRSVTGAERATVRFLQGHREAGAGDCAQLAARLAEDGVAAADLTLSGGATLDEGDVLAVLSPVVDLTDDEYALIDAFLENGGKLFYAVDASVDMAALPNFTRLASRFSLGFESGIVVEDEGAADYWMSSPLYLMPHVNGDAAAMAGMKADGRVILPGSRAVSGPELPLSGYTYEPLLTTSPRAYVKQTDSPAFTREDGDPTGQRTLAMSVRHETDGGELRAVLMGTLYAAVDNSLMASTANLDFAEAALRYLAEREDEVNVPVRPLSDTTMSIPSAARAYGILGLLLALPAATALIGALVIIRRRRR